MASHFASQPGPDPTSNEAAPALGRGSNYMEENRRLSGGLPDSPGDLVERPEFRQTSSRR